MVVNGVDGVQGRDVDPWSMSLEVYQKWLWEFF